MCSHQHIKNDEDLAWLNKRFNVIDGELHGSRYRFSTALVHVKLKRTIHVDKSLAQVVKLTFGVGM